MATKTKKTPEKRNVIVSSEALAETQTPDNHVSYSMQVEGVIKAAPLSNLKMEVVEHKVVLQSDKSKMFATFQFGQPNVESEIYPTVVMVSSHDKIFDCDFYYGVTTDSGILCLSDETAGIDRRTKSITSEEVISEMKFALTKMNKRRKNYNSFCNRLRGIKLDRLFGKELIYRIFVEDELVTARNIIEANFAWMKSEETAFGLYASICFSVEEHAWNTKIPKLHEIYEWFDGEFQDNEE